MSRTLHLSELVSYSHSTNAKFHNENEFLMLNVSQRNISSNLPSAFKIDCLSIFLCLRGSANIKVNFQPITLSAGSLLLLNPQNLIEISNDVADTDFSGGAIFLSQDFLNNLSLDSNTLDFSNIKFSAPPILQLTNENCDLMVSYMSLIAKVGEMNAERNIYIRNIFRSLIGAIFYQLMYYFSQNQCKHRDDENMVGRRSYYVRDFMRLVAKDFRSHRSVSYYASKLYISAKYLSLIIKESTGNTATEWIDHYVIIEAKNLLRFSGRNIQQIAYDLNFHNQSSFGKYFKHQTGMSPSEFRKS